MYSGVVCTVLKGLRLHIPIRNQNTTVCLLDTQNCYWIILCKTSRKGIKISKQNMFLSKKSAISSWQFFSSQIAMAKLVKFRYLLDRQ